MIQLCKKGFPTAYNSLFGSSSEDLFVSRVIKTITKTNKLSRRKKRGWFTKETMSTVLQWSAFLALNIGVVMIIYGTLGESPHIPLHAKNLVLAEDHITYYHPRGYIKSVVAYCEKPGNERLWKILIRSSIH